MLLLALLALAQDSSWLTPDGVEGFAWGTDAIPLDAVPRPKDLVLPDSAFIGASKQDRPDDLELKSPVPGERRFVRYARGAFVDAWLLAERPLDPEPLVAGGSPEWSGVVLGPGEDGYLAYGLARSWKVGDRTVLHWKDRASKRQLLVSRAAPSMQYGIGRAEPLETPGDTGARAELGGDLKKLAKPFAGAAASCFDQSPMPVEATIELKFDGAGAPSRVRVRADQPAFNLENCVAASFLTMSGPPAGQGTLTLRRFR